MCTRVWLTCSNNSKKFSKPWEILEPHWSAFNTQPKDTINNPSIQNQSWNSCGMCNGLLKYLSTSLRLNHQFGKKQKARLFLHLDLFLNNTTFGRKILIQWFKSLLCFDVHLSILQITLQHDPNISSTTTSCLSNQWIRAGCIWGQFSWGLTQFNLVQ